MDAPRNVERLLQMAELSGCLLVSRMDPGWNAALKWGEAKVNIDGLLENMEGA